MEVGIGFWIGFVVFVVVMLFLDLKVFHKQDEEIRVKPALYWSAFWIGLALLFNVGIYFIGDIYWGEVIAKQKALEFFTGYLIEKSLSVDNLFVFLMVFGFFGIQAKYQHRILFWGIIGAIVMRAIFIFAGVALIERFTWVMYVFGAFLVYTGIHMLFEKDDKNSFDPNKNFAVRLFRKFMPVSEDTSLTTFFVRKDKKLYATHFFIVLLLIEASDLIFAIDSIPAVLSVSKDPFIVYTSNIFAILGLRSLYFALNGVMQYFKYLKYALAFILSFIGIKMCINELGHQFGYNIHIGTFVSLGVIIVSLAISIFASVIEEKVSKKG